MPTVSPRVIAALPAGAIALIVFAVLVLVQPLVALVAALVAGAAVLWLLLRSATSRALRSLAAEPLVEGAEPRLESLVESICASHGISEPGLYVASSDALDAAVVGRSDDTRLVVTTGLLRGLDRLELEAVVARELSMFGSGVHAATMLAGVGSMFGPLGARLRERTLDDRRFVLADFEAVAVTRYPPGLAAAFEKAATGPRVSYAAASDHLWMIGSGRGASQPDLRERVDGLLEL